MANVAGGAGPVADAATGGTLAGIPGGLPYDPPDAVLPEINEDPDVLDQDPPPGTDLGTQQAVAFTVPDQAGVGVTEIQVQQASLEVVFQEGAFQTLYTKSGRVRVVVDDETDGWRYTVRRTGGWAKAPTFKVRARE